MGDNPNVKWGLQAMSAAMSARYGACGLRDRLRLSQLVLTEIPHDQEVLREVGLFLEAVELKPNQAGERLFQFVQERFPKNDVPRPTHQHAWQQRADLQ